MKNVVVLINGPELRLPVISGDVAIGSMNL